ncbi:MAG: FG-GAP repeat domain-containing protein, partial [Candidatus Xenobia bacterium]
MKNRSVLLSLGFTGLVAAIGVMGTLSGCGGSGGGSTSLFSATTSGARTADFTANRTLPSAPVPFRVLMVDVNGDGIADEITLSSGSTPSVQVALGNSSGSFQGPVSVALGVHAVRMIAADLQGNQRPDLVLVSDDDSVTVLPNDGAGGFSGTPVTVHLSGSTLVDVAAAHFLPHASLDVAVLDTAGQRVVVLPGNGDGTLNTVGALASAAGAAQAMAAADFDGANGADLALVDGSTTLTTLLNDGTGRLSIVKTTPNFGTIGLTGIFAADVDGDGHADVVAIDGTDLLGVGFGGGFPFGPGNVQNGGGNTTGGNNNTQTGGGATGGTNTGGNTTGGNTTTQTGGGTSGNTGGSTGGNPNTSGTGGTGGGTGGATGGATGGGSTGGAT